MTVSPVPDNLAKLVSSYEGYDQPPVRYRRPSWDRALATTPHPASALLADPGLTAEAARSGYRAKGDREVSRESVMRACRDLNLDDADAVVRAFVLVMAWGSGTSNSRSLRYVPMALANYNKAAYVLTSSARALREIVERNDDALQTVHQQFQLDGIGPSFYTKWFTFAGRRTGREWQPLILDDRVVRTLNRTLDVRLRDMTDGRGLSHRYAGYVATMHAWAEELSSRRDAVSADRLEWILFQQNGKPI